MILEADLPTEQREWYLKAAKQFGWSKVELIEKIATNAHEMIILGIDEEVCYARNQKSKNCVNSYLYIKQSNFGI